MFFCRFFFFFFFNDTATTEIYTLSLHDALPTSTPCRRVPSGSTGPCPRLGTGGVPVHRPGRPAAGDRPRTVRGPPGVRRRVRRRCRRARSTPRPATERGDVGHRRRTAGPDAVHPGVAVRRRGGRLSAAGILGDEAGLPRRAFGRRIGGGPCCR